MKELLSIFSAIWPMSPELENYLNSCLVTFELKKKQFLLKKNHICNYIYFVQEGILRSFYEDENKVETTKWLMDKGNIITSVTSFFTRTPTLEPIHTLTDCLLLGITHEQLYHAFKTYIEFNYHGRELTLKYHLMNESRISMLQRLTATEIFLETKRIQPEIVKKVPGKYLASYLGMDRATLSRIMKKYK